MEIWKKIQGHEPYEASNLGNIRRNKNLLKQGFCRKGYPRVFLSLSGNKKTIRTHILISIAFLNYKPDGTQDLVIDHIDNNKLNNNFENLQIVTNRYNASKNKINKTSNYTGVYWDKSRLKWHAEIRIGKTKKHLGRFELETDARDAYIKALNKINNV